MPAKKTIFARVKTENSIGILTKFRVMLKRTLVVFFCCSWFLTHAQVAGSGYEAIPMPGFFNANSLRYKQSLDAENGKVWVGTRDLGILVWSNATWTFWDPSNGCPDYNVTAIDLLPNGEAWVGCDTGGIGYYDGFAWNTFAYWNSTVPMTTVHSIKKSGNTVWAGTEHGLLKYDGQSWTQFTAANSGLPSDTIWDIEEDGFGGIYLATQQGLIQYINSTWSNYWGNSGSDAITDVHRNGNGKLFALSGGELFSYENASWSDVNQNGSLNFPGHPFSGGKSVTTTGQGSILVNGPRTTVYEFNSNSTKVYYIPILNGTATFSNNLLDADDITGEIWAVNCSNNNPAQSALIKFDFAGYNGLGKGLTPSNLRSLNINNTEAAIANRGDMHYDFINASYKCPKTQPASTVFCSNLWISGLDSLDSIHGAFQRYRVSQRGDFFPGPLNTFNGNIDSTTAWEFDRIWSVTQYEISEFQWQYAQGNVQNGTWEVPIDIAEWPANGNSSYSGELAPYVDVNNNGTYDPLTGGDYPLITGSQEMFWVFNDNLAAHSEVIAAPLGIQVNAQARAYYCPGATDSTELVNNITVCEFTIINRSGSNYHDVVISWAQDNDLGDWTDDYIGCDTLYNAGFCYNSDALDSSGSYPSFGHYPPIATNIILNGPKAPQGDSKDNDHDGITDEVDEEILLSGFQTYAASLFNAYGIPTTAQDYFNYQRAHWRDSLPLTFGGNGYGGNVPTNYIYSGNPTDTLQWSERSSAQTPGDRLMFLNCGPVSMNAGDTLHFKVAVATLNDSSLVWGTPQWYDQVPQACTRINEWNTNNTWPECAPLFDGIQEQGLIASSFVLYPNPSSNTITVDISKPEQGSSLVITDITGRIMYTASTENSSSLTISVAPFACGIYFVTLHNGILSSTQKFIRN